MLDQHVLTAYYSEGMNHVIIDSDITVMERLGVMQAVGIIQTLQGIDLEKTTDSTTLYHELAKVYGSEGPTVLELEAQVVFLLSLVKARVKGGQYLLFRSLEKRRLVAQALFEFEGWYYKYYGNSDVLMPLILEPLMREFLPGRYPSTAGLT